MENLEFHAPLWREYYHSDMWIEDGILFTRFKNNLHIDLRIATDVVKDRRDFSGGIIRPVFVDATNLNSVDGDARKYLTSDFACEGISFMSIYTLNPVTRILGYAFIHLYRPKTPASVFSDEHKAIAWLKEQVKP